MRDYAPHSNDRKELMKALHKMGSNTYQVPMIIGSEFVTMNEETQLNPSTKKELCRFSNATPEIVHKAITNALEAKKKWEKVPFEDRCAIFLKAADLLTNKYRYQVMAATMLGQGKNIWQAEIDAACELADFWRFNCKFAQQIYEDQPPENAPGMWNRVEYRPLEGFVYAISPFNFTAIGGNLVSAPALMGNVVLWKPSNSAIYSNFLVMEILREAGLPDGVIQFVPGDPQMVTKEVLSHPEFAGLHFTGSTAVFKHLWKEISKNLDSYKSYPRIVGETGGKNMHFIHESANVKNAVLHTIRGAFEYNGQKCSATSRCYVPESLYEGFITELKKQLSQLKMGNVEDPTNFAGPVIHQQSYDKITKYISQVKNGENESSTIIAGGNYSDKEGFYIEPTVIVTKDPKSPTMVTELFGPVLTIYSYPNEEFMETLDLADQTSSYGLTCGM
jgi:1-pyrroline-5-carboxylate dehydrogenase